MVVFIAIPEPINYIFSIQNTSCFALCTRNVNAVRWLFFSTVIFYTLNSLVYIHKATKQKRKNRARRTYLKFNSDQNHHQCSLTVFKCGTRIDSHPNVAFFRIHIILCELVVLLNAPKFSAFFFFIFFSFSFLFLFRYLGSLRAIPAMLK